MKSYNFEVAHGYEIWKGYVTAENEEEAKNKILNKGWDDIVDEFDTDVFTEEYKIVDIWE